MSLQKSAPFSIIPSVREKHGYDVDHQHNNIYLPNKQIKRVQNLYNSKTPFEQLALYYMITEKVLREDVRDLLRDILLGDERDFFDDAVLLDDQKPQSRDFLKYIKTGEELFLNKSGHRPRKNERDLHHIIPRSRKDEGFETGTSHNKFYNIGKQFHKRWHQLYTNKHPLESLRYDLNRNMQVLAKETRQKIGEIVYLDNEEFYNDSVLNEENKRQ